MEKIVSVLVCVLLMGFVFSFLPENVSFARADEPIAPSFAKWRMDIDVEDESLASFWGEDAEDRSGYFVSGTGDVNGDGYDDILIGARLNDDGGDAAGQTYLIFGKAAGWSMDTDLSNADASFWGEDAEDRSGNSVSGAGDVNGDGYDDILIGASGDDDGGSDAGQTYLIFGKAAGWSMDTDLSTADASFWGEDADDWSGVSVSGAGDVNDDGYDDILIGASGDDDGGTRAGQTYLIFGKAAGWSMDTDLSNADASFWGEDAEDRSGNSVSGTGDVNGDGYDDILIGAYLNGDGGFWTGQTYLIFGETGGWSMDTDLSNADASFWGEDAEDRSGYFVSGTGDVNGDGYDDILIGARLNDDGGDAAGQTYLIFGKAGGWSMDTDLSNADASFWGEDMYDVSGVSVSGAGDVNGDGFDDILIGAWGDDDGGDAAGQTYLIFGKAAGWSMDTDLSNADASFWGEDADDRSGQYVSGLGDVNGDGYDDILIGAPLSDEGGKDAGQTYLIEGGFGDIKFFTDQTPETGTTGDELTFSIMMMGQYPIYSMFVEYWFGEGEHISVSMTDYGNLVWNHKIIIPTNSLDRLYYNFSAPVSSRQWINTSIRNITIFDDDGPEFTNDHTDTSAYTGDPFKFLFDGVDNIGINNTYIEYWFGTGLHTTLSAWFESGTRWGGTILVPPDSLDPIYYKFIADDYSGNMNETMDKEIPVYDNDKPAFINNEKITSTTGDITSIFVNVTDNIGVSKVHFEYWYSEGSVQNITLDKGEANEWRGEISVIDKIDTLNFRFLAVDNSGNWNHTLIGESLISDNDLPQFGEDTSDIIATTGGSFNFRIEITDNNLLDRSYVKYWCYIEEQLGTSLSGMGPFESTIVIPLNWTELSYCFHAVDSFENHQETEVKTIEIIDVDLPTILEHRSKDSCDTGCRYTISVEVSDNIEISDVMVEYRYGMGVLQDLILELEEDLYLGYIEVPVNSIDSLFYKIKVIDAAGNENESSIYEVYLIDIFDPRLESVDDLTIYEGEEIDIALNADDNIGITSYSWSGSPIEDSGDRLVGIPEEAGEYMIQIIVRDAEGNTNSTSFTLTVLPTDHDEDDDGIPDLVEIEFGLDPDDNTDAALDLDSDGVTNKEEYVLGTTLDESDSDGDGFSDGYEVANGFDPLDPTSGKDVTAKDDDGGGSSIWIIIVVIVVLLLVAVSVGVFLFLKKKREETAPEGSLEETPLPGITQGGEAKPQLPFTSPERPKLPTPSSPPQRQTLPVAPPPAQLNQEVNTTEPSELTGQEKDQEL